MRFTCPDKEQEKEEEVEEEKSSSLNLGDLFTNVINLFKKIGGAAGSVKIAASIATLAVVISSAV